MGKIKNGVKKFTKSLLNVRVWMDWTRLQGFFHDTKETAASLFIIKQATHQETFPEAMQRMHLTEEDIQNRIKEFKLLIRIHMVVFTIVLIYLIYLIIAGHWRAVMACTGILFIIAAFIFRFHFWYFQLRKRRLGCSWQEWLKEAFLASKK